ncbi:MAG: hypothetical protein JKP98_18710 [Rhodobacteraceae bacterium]|nr:hypothetical protein [Paracoccaceae bacterium]
MQKVRLMTRRPYRRRSRATSGAACWLRVRHQGVEQGNRATFEASLGKLKDQKTADDRATWLELFGVEAFRNPKFSSLALDIMDEVADRFAKIDAGNTERSATDWPIIWTFSCPDRDEFLAAVRWFSSNHHKQFGRLLTPLVDGIRVQGPLYPDLGDDTAELKLVL